jgi:hypothetical protein
MTKHPYIQYEALAVWGVISRAVDELVDNQDLQETTARQYIVGSLCKALDDAGLLVNQPLDPR